MKYKKYNSFIQQFNKLHEKNEEKKNVKIALLQFEHIPTRLTPAQLLIIYITKHLKMNNI